MNSKKWSYKFTQPYANWQPYQLVDAKACETEMAKIEMIDRWVNVMSSYPDAEEMMKKIKES